MRSIEFTPVTGTEGWWNPCGDFDCVVTAPDVVLAMEATEARHGARGLAALDPRTSELLGFVLFFSPGEVRIAAREPKGGPVVGPAAEADGSRTLSVACIRVCWEPQRGRGIGSALAREMLCWAAEYGHRHVEALSVLPDSEFAYTNDRLAALSFWERLGFAAVGSTEWGSIVRCDLTSACAALDEQGRWCAEMAEHSDPSVRGLALWRLARDAPDRAVPILLRSLADQSPVVGTAASDALTVIPSEAALDGLIAALETPGPARIRAVDALRKIGDRRAVPALVSVLEGLGFENPYLQRRVVMALRALADERALPALARLLPDADRGLRVGVFHAMVVAADPAAGDYMWFLPRGVEALLPFVHNKDGSGRRAAIALLVRDRSEEAMDPLIEATHDPDPRTRAVATLAIGLADGARWTGELAHLVNDGEPSLGGRPVAEWVSLALGLPEPAQSN